MEEIKKPRIALLEDIILPFGFEYYLNNMANISGNTKISALTITDENIFINNIDVFKRIIKENRVSCISCGNYNIAKLVEENLPQKSEMSEKTVLNIIDDFENRDRSYINSEDFKKTDLAIPLSYIMWGVKFDQQIRTTLGAYIDEKTGAISNRNNFSEIISKTELYEIERITSIIGTESRLNAVEKLIIISNYIQAYFQYVDGKESHSIKGTFALKESDEKQNYSQRNSSTLLFGNYGICETFAKVTTLLANNPILDLNVRIVSGGIHEWNIIVLNGKMYYIDNTWAVSRNPDSFENALKAKSFTSKFLLFGNSTAEEIKNHSVDPRYILPMNLNEEDFDKDYIEAAVNYLRSLGLLEDVYPDNLLTFDTVKTK